MKVTEAEFVKGFIRLCDDGFKQNWHERNGGNLSYRIKPEEVESVKEELTDTNRWQPIGTSVPKLAGEYFMVTGSGKYFRNVILDPAANCCIIEVDEAGENYRICWGLVNGGRPTSEPVRIHSGPPSESEVCGARHGPCGQHDSMGNTWRTDRSDVALDL